MKEGAKKSVKVEKDGSVAPGRKNKGREGEKASGSLETLGLGKL
jgi:hypothetical protein